MKVLVWSQYYWPENFHINDVVSEMVRQGVEVTVLTGKPNYPDGAIFSGYRPSGINVENHDGAEVIRVPLFPRGRNSAFKLLLNYISFIASGYIVAPWVLRGRKFDAIFVYAPSPLFQALPAMWLSRLKGAPLIVWVQDLWPESLRATGFITNKWLLKLVETVVAEVYRGAERILIQSEAFRPSVSRLLRANRRNAISYFPNSAPPSQVNSGVQADSELSVKISANFSIVFAGNIGRAQSCETIIKAAHILRSHVDIRFFIIGSGSQAADIVLQAERLGLDNVVFTGRVHPSEMGAVYKASSVLLLTLRNDPALSMTVPSKFQSYLAAGRPVVVSCNGEVANLVEQSGCGLAVPAEDAVQLAAAILKLKCAEGEKLVQMAERGRDFFIQNYMLTDNVEKLVGIFSEVRGGS